MTKDEHPGIMGPVVSGSVAVNTHKLRISVLALSVVLASCGGGGGGSSAGPIAVTPTPSPTPTSTCSLRARQDFAFATLNEWYLFPETLPASLDPTPYASVDTYIDALTATARAQGRDRFLTYITSIAQEDAFFNSGSSAGFGVRLSNDATNKRAFIAEAFEGAPALAAGIDRGTEILAIGDTPTSLRTVNAIITAEGTAGISNALGPSTAGTTRTLQISNAGVVSTVTVSKADYTLTPVSARYGAKILNDGGKKVGYLNLRTFISTANPELQSAFANFKAQGVNEFIIDFRYNGGGLVSTAELMGDLLGGGRTTSDVFSNTTFRTSKSSNNSTKRFAPRAESVTPTKIAFIGTSSTASASELVMNGMSPYLGQNLALVGSNTFGKPTGQIAIDKTACDDRIRVIAFSTQNSAGGGFYYNGLASVLPKSCAAPDDITKPLGDVTEGSIKGALDFLGGRTCSAIASGGQTSQALRDSGLKLLTPDAPTVVQREVPGAF
jgi:C-terminal processing protease CtpA/Prc